MTFGRSQQELIDLQDSATYHDRNLRGQFHVQWHHWSLGHMYVCRSSSHHLHNTSLHPPRSVQRTCPGFLYRQCARFGCLCPR